MNRFVLAPVSGLLSGLLCGLLLVSEIASAQPIQFDNPLILERADPFIYRHTDGYYYCTATVPAYDSIELRRADSLEGLSTAGASVIWRAHATGEMASHIWAPELHYVDGTWYIYFAAGSSSNVWDIRVYVLSNDSANPLEGTWAERGQLMTNGPKSSGSFFALDATTFEHKNVRYLIWAESDPSLDVNTVLYIAPMSNPWTLAERGVRISAPEYDWERVGYAVNEGPAVLRRNGKVFVTYSASATDANYCMGLLTADDTSDLLDAGSWDKSKEPVFRSKNGVYGPGHNQFTTTPDGSVDLLVYHGRDYERIEGDPLNDPNRATRVQPIAWNDDGTPNLGDPLGDGTVTIDMETSSGGTAGAAGTTDGGTAGAAGTTDGGGGTGLGGAVEVGSGGVFDSSGGARSEGGSGPTTVHGGSGGAVGVGGVGAMNTGSGGTAAGEGGFGGGAHVAGAAPALGGASGAPVGGGGPGGTLGGGGAQTSTTATGGVATTGGRPASDGGSVGGSPSGVASPSGGAQSSATSGDAKDSGCGCTVLGQRRWRGAFLLAALALGLGWRRRTAFPCSLRHR